jgi:tRNA threonylcarbamoyl adenosine modification protein YeaZ
MLILAFDTTSEKGGVGIFKDAECLAAVPNQGPANLSSITLFEMVEQALKQARLDLREIGLYAVANGPGSFTGIRVGLAAARAWGMAFARPVRGVSVLAALVSKARPRSDWAFPILDARRGEFYAGSFRKTPDVEASGAGSGAECHPALHPAHRENRLATGLHYEPVDAGWVLRPEPLRVFLEERLANGASATCLVRAHDQAAHALANNLPPSLGWQWIEGTLMDSIASIALEEEQAGRPCSASRLDAYYIRRPDAEINWKD